MSKRMMDFKDMFDCPIRKLVIRRLGNSGREFVENYITKFDHLDKHQWAKQVNMIFVDDPNKPKNHVDIWAALTSVNG